MVDFAQGRVALREGLNFYDFVRGTEARDITKKIEADGYRI